MIVISGYVKLKSDSTFKYYLDDYTIETEKWISTNAVGDNYKYDSVSSETITGDTETMSGQNAGVKIIIPIENIIDKTATSELPFNLNDSKITYGKAVVRVVWFHYESGYDGPGATPKDPLIIKASFGEQNSTVQRNDVSWRWFSTKGDYHYQDFEFTFDESDEIPETISIDVEWGADATDMHIGIDSAYVEVSYKQ